MQILHNIFKAFNQNHVLCGICLDIAPHGITCLLGASGCGKSTLLRIIAGLEQADSGTIKVQSGQCAMVFQDPRLLPWLTVRENLSLALPATAHHTEQHLAEALTMVELAPRLLSAMPRELSGGMAQRVGIARALLRSPELMLMDEPLASLDAITREKLQDMLRTLMHTRTCLFVTHDLTEAFRIAERICVMDGGKVSVYYDRSAFADPDRRNIIRQHIVSHLNNKENSFL